MKKTFITLLICSINLSLFAQSDVWTKADRTNLYDDCMSYVTKYKNTTNDQRESVSLCYIGEVTKKYTKADFQAMIDIEIKRIKEAVINQCAKNLGIDLNIEPKKEEVVVEKKEVEAPKNISNNMPTKEVLVGKWKTAQNSIIEFKSDGTYYEKFLYRKITKDYNFVVDDVYTGDWFLDDKGVLTLALNWKEDHGTFKEKIRNFTNTSTYKFTAISIDYIKYEDTTPGYEPIQANRIK